METATNRQLGEMFGRSLCSVKRILYDVPIRPVIDRVGRVPARYAVEAFAIEVERRNKRIATSQAINKEGRLCAVCGKDFVCYRVSKQATCSKVCAARVRMGQKKPSLRPKTVPTKQKYAAWTYTDKPLKALIAESVLPESLKSHLLPRKAQSSKGSTVRKRHDKKRGMCWAALSICANCGDEYWSSGERSYHSAQCKSAIGNVRTCKWCGKVEQGKRNRHSKYCSGGCAQAGLLYGTRPEREIMASAAYDATITRGLTLKQAVVDMDTSHQKIISIMTYRCGPMFREWANDRQCAINPSGFKGMGSNGERSKKLAFEPLKERLQRRGSKERQQGAIALRMWRQERPNAEIAATVGCAEASVIGFLTSRSKAYRNKTASRMAGTSWRTGEQAKRYRSKKYPKEAAFRDYVADVLEGGGYNVEVEHPVKKGSQQRVDAMAEIMGTRFALEAKVTARSSRADQCLGQALRKGANLNAIPVVLFPSDVLMSSEFMAGFASLVALGAGVRLCNELNVCGVLAMDKGEWVDHCETGGLVLEWSATYGAVREPRPPASMTSKPCPVCHKAFTRYASLNHVCCSRTCGMVLRHKNIID